MSRSRHANFILFCLIPFTISAARAQSCADQMRQTSSQQASRMISASDLGIPAKAWQHFERARTAADHNQPEVLDREAAQALATAPRFAEVYLLQAAQQVRKGLYEQALQTVSTARQIQPNLPWSSVVVASALNQLHRYNEAVAELDRARGDEIESWQDKFERARAETGRQNVEAALHWSTLAVEAAPEGCTDARILRANALQLAGRLTEAVVELETYLAQDRQNLQKATRAQVLAVMERTRKNAQEQSQTLMAHK